MSTVSSSSRPGTQQQPKPEKPNWRVSFGFWTKLDALYHSFSPPSKPRCPSLPFDSASEWKKRLVPGDIERFLDNPAAVACIRAVISRIDTDTAPALTNFLISGGHSTGKASFTGILRKTLQTATFEQPCRFFSLNASVFADKVLQSKLEDAVKRLDASKAGAPSFLIIERFESVTPSTQQHFFLPLLAEANLKRVFVILLVRPDANKLAEQIRTQSMTVPLRPLSADLVRTKLLLICKQERIGYTREGLEALAKICSFKLVPSMEKLHEVFLKQYFISQANVMKVCQPTFSMSSPAVPPFPLSIIQMSKPLRRCPKCTLLPPCSHIPLEKLFSRIDPTRALYPNNGQKKSTITTVKSSNPDQPDTLSPAAPERPICPSFRQRGICINVQKLGRCRYAHPLDLHVIDTTALASRCQAHTLPLPCMHCSNAEQLKLDFRKETTACENLKRELLHCRQALADLETQRYVFARDRGKTAKWGGAKKAADEQLARMDATLSASESRIAGMKQELMTRQEDLLKLQDAAVHGRSRGLGKGRGQIERNKAAAVATV
ncbi:hypothetical protein PInf_019804 [Phytophthora infestans]|nr:hypothetical protein PInf_019804 [Phytophthora infestans]